MLGFDGKMSAVVEAVSHDIIASSGIEGVMLDSEQVRSSVARKLGLKSPNPAESSRYIDGVVEMAIDATSNYEKPLTIPVYQQEDTDGLTRVVYPLPYEFLGVTESGWFFFIVPDDTGYHIQMIQKDGLRILNRHLELNHKDVLYHNFSLSSEGIISVLLAYTDNVTVSWWRTDSLIDSILKE